jgi:hypothetical protein
MRPIHLWPTSSRIIEVGATNGALCQRLVAAGYNKYLAVASSKQRCETFARQQPSLRRRVVAASSAKVVQQNNADVLILSGWSALALSRVRSVRHAKFVALKLQPTPLCWFALLVGLVQCLLFRFAPPQLVHYGTGGAGPWLLAFKVRLRRPHDGVRRFIPHQSGVCGLLYGLQTAGVRHAVLRWFESLPQIAPGEDLDLLVDDSALEQVRGMLDDGPGIQPVDLYSVTGLPGSDFRSMPYFPPYLAEELLDRAAIHHGLCRVPAPREHFLSLAYHALYHKGTDSGIPATNRNRSKSSKSDHDYVEVINRLAGEIGLTVETTLEALDSCLDAHGWRPPHDMLIRLSRRNRWVRSLLQHPAEGARADDQTAVFLLREEGMRRGGVEKASRLIENYGFQVKVTQVFDERTTATVARSLRGGNWGRGPWPVSGGPPVAAIVAHDPAPITPTRRDRKRFPFVANARLLCKEQLRDAFNYGYPKEQHCNVIHSSDNGREAMDYLRIIMPDNAGEIVGSAHPQGVSRAA